MIKTLASRPVNFVRRNPLAGFALSIAAVTVVQYAVTKACDKSDI